MRITIDIDAEKLLQVQKITGKKMKSPAVVQAVSEFLQQHQRQQFIERALSGHTDYPLTNDELEARDVYETR